MWTKQTLNLFCPTPTCSSMKKIYRELMNIYTKTMKKGSKKLIFHNEFENEHFHPREEVLIIVLKNLQVGGGGNVDIREIMNLLNLWGHTPRQSTHGHLSHIVHSFFCIFSVSLEGTVYLFWLRQTKT